MIGPIRGARLVAEVKLQIVRAVADAKDQGMTIDRACRVILLDSRRLRRWVGGRDVNNLSQHDLGDRPPVAKVAPHALSAKEKAEIIKAADEPGLADERHRNLTHRLSRQNRVWCSESSTLRVLRAAGKVPRYQRRSRSKAAKARGQRRRAQSDLALRHHRHSHSGRPVSPDPGARQLLSQDRQPLLRPRENLILRPGRMGLASL
ncbi:MAG: hypothetical protein ACT4OM_05680 [Actinomycetota bacterium]